MWIMISHPYRSNSDDPAVWAANLRAMNEVAVALWERGHVPIIGVNAALPVIAAAGEERYEEIMMPLALSLLDRCDAVLRVGGYSKGAEQEADKARSMGLPVYQSLEEVPSTGV
jgi:hypothetical protein